jgi:hypothetical protein
VPLTLQDMERAIRAAWSRETTFASDEYLSKTPDRPSRGQCGPTALVVHDLLGGDLLVSDVAVDGVVDGVHYWNRLSDGVYVDLTRDQFAADEVVLPPRVVPRPALPKPERARAAYLLLRARVLTALSPACEAAAEQAWSRLVHDAAMPSAGQH